MEYVQWDTKAIKDTKAWVTKDIKGIKVKMGPVNVGNVLKMVRQ
jgi:hypothetical protein